MQGIAPTVSSTYSFEEGDEGEGEGKVLTVAVAPDTPMATVTVWNGDRKVGLVVVSREVNCCARVGSATAKVDFLFCVKPAGDCEELSHTLPTKRFVLQVPERGEFVAIRAHPKTWKRDDTAFSLPLLDVNAIPAELLSEGILGRLTRLEVLPRVARVLLEFYPGKETMAEMYEEWMPEKPKAKLRGDRPRPAAIDTERTPRSEQEANDLLEEVGAGGDQTPGPKTPGAGGSRRGGRPEQITGAKIEFEAGENDSLYSRSDEDEESGAEETNTIKLQPMTWKKPGWARFNTKDGRPVEMEEASVGGVSLPSSVPSEFEKLKAKIGRMDKMIKLLTAKRASLQFALEAQDKALEDVLEAFQKKMDRTQRDLKSLKVATLPSTPEPTPRLVTLTERERTKIARQAAAEIDFSNYVSYDDLQDYARRSELPTRRDGVIDPA